MNDMTRREALRIASLAVAGLVAGTACDGDGDPEQGEEPKKEEPKDEPKIAVTKRAEYISVRSLICGAGPLSGVWAGPGGSVVHITLVADRECRTIVYFVDAAEQVEEAGITVENGRTSETTVTVPEGKMLAFNCTGVAFRACRLSITGVVPPLPENVTKGAAEVIRVSDPVRDPATPPPIGTPIQVTCGKDAVLWSGRPSYVTVTLRGSARCNARVESEGAQPSSESSEGYVPFCRTFGPVTQVKGYCDGAGQDHCEFMVGETIELP